MKLLDLEKKLQKKGWDNKDISKTIDIIIRAESNKHPYVLLLDKMLYWFAIFAIVIACFIVSFALIPILTGLNPTLVIICTAVLGLTFGALIDIFVRDIEYLSAKHYLIPGIFIPVIAIGNITFTYHMTLNAFEGTFNVAKINPIIIAIIYFISFSAPHITNKLLINYERRILKAS